MAKTRVMIIDDSALMRCILTDLVSSDPDMEVVSSLGNAEIAIKSISRVLPDIITLDIEMPVMDGLTALSEIRKIYPKLPVIMCSSLVRSGMKATLDALMRGANDYIVKPMVIDPSARKEAFELLQKELLLKIRGLVKKQPAEPPSMLAPIAYMNPLTSVQRKRNPIHIVAIGCSTGGPNALSVVLSKIPSDFPVPIVIVQHMPPIFTQILAESLTKKSSLSIKEAHDGAVLLPGHVLIAPGGHHMTVGYKDNQFVVELNKEPPENYCRPAVDVLFRSVAKHFGANVLAVVMTGMGQDGLLGCRDIKGHGGQIIVQDEESSVVWGMPGAVSKANLSDKVCALSDVAFAILQSVTQKRVTLGLSK